MDSNDTVSLIACTKRYRHSDGGDTIRVEGLADFLEKLDQAMISGYLEKDEKGKPIALYIHITREEDVRDFQGTYSQVIKPFLQ